MPLRLLQPHRGAQSGLSALAAPDFQFRRNAVARDGGAFPSTEQKPGLPRVEPGQVWLVEVVSGQRLSGIARHLIKSANVVVYDRGLASGVAEILPLGGYAEPAPSGDAAGAAAIDRCARFARDGWAMVRLIDGVLARADRQRWLQAVSARLRAGGVAGSPRIFIDGQCSADAADDSTLYDIDIGGESTRGEGLIVVFAASVPETARPILAVAGNGLAG
jgi:hypothetical protein